VERKLSRAATTVPLTPKVFDILLLLVENNGQIVEKDRLMQEVWPDTFVEEGNLTQNISTLRKALREQEGGHQFIQTVSKRGYRFVGDVKELARDGISSLGEDVAHFRVTEAETRAATVSERSSVKAGDDFNESEARGARAAKADVAEQAVAQPKLRQGGLSRRGRWALAMAATVAALVLVMISLNVGGWRTRNISGPAPARVESIAVLPLDNLSGDPSQEYLADGVTEAIISNLAQIRSLKVISRTSVMRYSGKSITGISLPEIARELNVDAVVEGSVQRSGGRVQVSAQLIHGATDRHLWAASYERDASDILKLESEVARAIADEIRIQVTAEERARLSASRNINPQAHEAYLLGRHHFSKYNEQDWKQAIEYFERAIQLAPDYAAAYAGLSDTWQRRGIFSAINFEEAELPARAAALMAIKLDEQLAEGHISLGNVKEFYDWDWAGAEAEFRRALELDPGSVDAHTFYAVLLMHLERSDEAIRQCQVAEQLDPLSAATQSVLGRVLYRARRYEEALPHLQRAVEIEPRRRDSNFRLGDVYTELGRYDEAIRAFQNSRELVGDNESFRVGVARVYAKMGRAREARQMIRGVKAGANVARVYTALGDRDAAFRILENAIDKRTSGLVVLKSDPPLDSLHQDPRWKAMLHRMNFPQE
ncbi:MAG TPA: tetratricopeptide repeat protein, partial [Blastocatellia bacterium]|nr:tetratricopeptide repeat protein [Blastocatellia bacterium]